MGDLWPSHNILTLICSTLTVRNIRPFSFRLSTFFIVPVMLVFTEKLQVIVVPGYSIVNIWQYGSWRFQTGGTKLERFLSMNQHTRRKLLNFGNWVNGEVSKSGKIWLSKSIFYVKNYLNLSYFFFFSLKNINLGAHFLLLTFFDNINF